MKKIFVYMTLACLVCACDGVFDDVLKIRESPLDPEPVPVVEESLPLYNAVKTDLDALLLLVDTGSDPSQIYEGKYCLSAEDNAAIQAVLAEIAKESDFLKSAGLLAGADGLFAEKLAAALGTLRAALIPGKKARSWDGLRAALTDARALWTSAGLDNPDAKSIYWGLLGNYNGTTLVNEGLLDKDAYEIVNGASDKDKPLYYFNALYQQDLADAIARAANIIGLVDAGTPPGLETGQPEIDALTSSLTANHAKFENSKRLGYWVTVPAGKFQRDKTTDNNFVITKPYKVGVYEVTQELWKAVLGSARNYSYFNDDQKPAHGYEDAATTTGNKMGWNQMIFFCNELSRLKSKSNEYVTNSSTPSSYAEVPTAYPTANASARMRVGMAGVGGYRMLTEAEWMWAAMGADRNASDMSGGVNINGYTKKFAGDDSTNSLKDYAYTPIATWGDTDAPYNSVTGGFIKPSGSTVLGPQKVGLLKPNQLGIYDMSGNVSEYVFDRTPGNNAHSATNSSQKRNGGTVWTSGTLTDWYSMPPTDVNVDRTVILGGDYLGQYPVQVSRAFTDSATGPENWQRRPVGFRIAYTP